MEPDCGAHLLLDLIFTFLCAGTKAPSGAGGGKRFTSLMIPGSVTHYTDSATLRVSMGCLLTGDDHLVLPHHSNDHLSHLTLFLEEVMLRGGSMIPLLKLIEKTNT